MRKTLHTQLYTPDGLKLVKRLRTAFNNKWNTSQMSNATRRFASAVVEPDREVSVPPGEFYYSDSRLWQKNDNEILKWMAIHLKLVVKTNHEWYRANDEVVSELSEDDFKVTVSDAYLVYDHWLRRKNIEMKFSKGQFERWIGTPADPVTTEIEVARRQEIEDAKAACKQKIEAAQKEMYRKNEDYRKQTLEEFNQAQAAAEAERDRRIKELNDSVKGPVADGLAA